MIRDVRVVAAVLMLATSSGVAREARITLTTEKMEFDCELIEAGRMTTANYNHVYLACIHDPSHLVVDDMIDVHLFLRTSANDTVPATREIQGFFDMSVPAEIFAGGTVTGGELHFEESRLRGRLTLQTWDYDRNGVIHPHDEPGLVEIRPVEVPMSTTVAEYFRESRIPEVKIWGDEIVANAEAEGQ